MLYLKKRNFIMAIFSDKSSRRKFLQNFAGAAGAIGTIGMYQPFPVKAKAKKLNLALLSDLHVPEDVYNNYRGFYPYNNFRTAAKQVADSGLKAAIITGDLARLTGEPGDYSNLKQLSQPIAEKMPVAMAMGNHDHREHFLDAFTTTTAQKQELKNKYVLVMDHPEIQLIILDSLMTTNFTPGFLGKVQREWLASYLETNKNKAILLFFHHSLGDGDNDLLDVDRLFKIIAPHRQVKAIFYGHSHVYNFGTRDDIHLINLPALGYNFTDKDPIGWVEASLTKKGGTLTLHAIGGNITEDEMEKELIWRK